MNKRTLVLGVVVALLFVVALVGAISFTGSGTSGNVHTMPDGRTMTGADTISDEMPGMTHDN